MEQFKSHNTPYLFLFNCLIFCINMGVECVFVRQDTSSGPFQHHLGASYSWHAAIPCTRAATGLKDDYNQFVSFRLPQPFIAQGWLSRRHWTVAYFSDFGGQRWIKEEAGRYQRSCRTSRRLHQMLGYCPHDMSACLYDSIDM